MITQIVNFILDAKNSISRNILLQFLELFYHLSLLFWNLSFPSFLEPCLKQLKSEITFGVDDGINYF